MGGPGLQYWAGDLYAKQDELILKLKITGDNAFSILPANNSAVMIVPDGTALTAQSQIDNFLGTTSEFLVAAFNSTSITTDTFGFIINMYGDNQSSPNTTTNTAQSAQVLAMEAVNYSGTNGATAYPIGVVGTTGALTQSNTSVCSQGSYGNIAGRCVMTGLSSISSGLIVVRIHWVSI